MYVCYFQVYAGRKNVPIADGIYKNFVYETDGSKEKEKEEEEEEEEVEEEEIEQEEGTDTWERDLGHILSNCMQDFLEISKVTSFWQPYQSGDQSSPFPWTSSWIPSVEKLIGFD